MKNLIVLIGILLAGCSSFSDQRIKTACNPVNLKYAIINEEGNIFRDAYFPTAALHDGHYYMTVHPNKECYKSDDLINWIPADSSSYALFKDKEVSINDSLIRTDNANNGWETPGDYNEWLQASTTIDRMTMLRHDGKYYLLYSTPGMSLKSANCAVYTSENSTGPFILSRNNPVAYKPEGFTTGAGGGSIFQNKYGNYWFAGTTATTSLNFINRRICIYPLFFDSDGEMYVCTGWGDYPFIIPEKKIENPNELITDWMLLSYRKYTEASSELRNHPTCCVSDEDIRTYWSAESNKKGEYLLMDLENECKVFSIQINFSDEGLSKREDTGYGYYIQISSDKKKWKNIIDRTEINSNPHDYIQLDSPVKGRYIRVVNSFCPAERFSISGLRIFGESNVIKPLPAEIRYIERDSTDRRKATIKWNPSKGADGYILSYGTSPDKLYLSHK